MALYYIYCIWVKTEDGVLRYYGHTQNMRVRKNLHVCDHKKWVASGRPEKVGDVNATRSVYILDHEDWRMDKVDEIECDDKKDAEKLEGEWILKNDCVNMCVAGRTRQEFQKQYRQSHKTEIAKCKKQYREQHKEQIAEYFKQYSDTHKEEFAAKRAEKVTCEVCNVVVTKGAIAKHRKSKNHLNALNALNPDINTIQ